MRYYCCPSLAVALAVALTVALTVCPPPHCFCEGDSDGIARVTARATASKGSSDSADLGCRPSSKLVDGAKDNGTTRGSQLGAVNSNVFGLAFRKPFLFSSRVTVKVTAGAAAGATARMTVRVSFQLAREPY